MRTISTIAVIIAALLWGTESAVAQAEPTSAPIARDGDGVSSPAGRGGAPASAPAPLSHPSAPPAPASDQPGQTFRDFADSPEMVVIPAGSFTMGSPEAETSREQMPDLFAAWERPQHPVSVRSFAMGKYAVTFAEWDACVSGGGCNGYRPANGGWGRGNRPVINVNWHDAQAYVQWLNGRVRRLAATSPGPPDGPYRLPSEAEWEYAARAGTVTARYWGDAIGAGNANCNGCGSRWDGRQTAPVGSFPPNPFGLYDILGNVWQWTEDCWHETYAGAPADGDTWAGGTCGLRVVRGGSWTYFPRYLRAASRYGYLSIYRYVSLGFRLARTLP